MSIGKIVKPYIMKKLLFYIIALPCLVLALDGCRKEEKVPDGGSSSPVISIHSCRGHIPCPTP
jgi:hypothetical protein